MFNKKNIFLFVLGICLSTNVFTNSTSALDLLYKENKWDFMDDMFVTKLNSTKSSFDKYDKLIQFGPMALSPLLLLLGVKSDEFVNVFISILTLSYFLVGLPASFLFRKITSSKKTIERFTKILDEFFENYSDEKEASSEKTNYRDFVPEEYLNIFDLIYKEYKTDKTKALTLFVGIVYKIRDKIIYDIKLEKYREPIVVNNSSYVHVVR